jgi:predicted RecB family nuclease
VRLLDGSIVLSPSDLAKFTRCAHATTLDLGRLRGTLQPLAGPHRSLHTEFVARKGTEHEQQYIERLALSGNQLIQIRGERKTAEDLRNAAADTLDAMRSGVDYVYQAVFFDDGWVGYADLLERVALPSDLGDWSYEAVDTKLARTVKPHFILQLCVYSELLGRAQGRAPAKMHVVLGTQERATFRCADVDAYYRYIRTRFEERIAHGNDNTLPYVIDFCSLCEWNLHCWRHLEQLDHLVRVANIRRDHVRKLQLSGVTTLTQLGATPSATVEGVRVPAYAAMHQQARLQSEQIATKQHRYELLQLETERGFERLPRPSAGDVVLDIEADPYAGDGITYLFGIAFSEGDLTQYRAFWAHDARQEKQAFEDVVDFFMARYRDDPSMHIYHYGALDASALKRMSGEYGTREQEIDDFLRHRVFVDLFTVVRQAMRISQPSYSLKKVEAFYFDREEEGVFEAGGPILAYEQWLETQDPAMLETIERYNREDCVSTVELRTWLLRLREEAEAQYGHAIPWLEVNVEEQSQNAIDVAMQNDAISAALLASVSADLIGTDDEQRARWLLAHLIHYHRREARPAWWWFFDRLKMSPEELIDDRESIGGLEIASDLLPHQVDRSLVHTLHFPPQHYKIAAGDKPVNPETKKGAGTIVNVDDAHGLLELKRGNTSLEPLPRALIPGRPVPTNEQRQALRRLAESVVNDGFDGSRYRACADILLRRVPRLRSAAAGSPLHGEHVDDKIVTQLVADLDQSYLFVQGPPGAGKTWCGARAVVALLRAGKRVGVAASTHKAIHNLLDEIEKVAQAEGASFRGLKKRGIDDESEYTSRHIATSKNSDDFIDPTIRLLAGTSWLFANDLLDQSLDYVFIDEAGQVSLANALAIGTASRNIVLLGDPLQLAQVSQAVHPGASGASVLEHLLGIDATIPRERGVFLERTWRMHPDVCRFVSEVVYDARLESAAGCECQNIDRCGTGLRFIAVEHEANSQSSTEEALRVADEISRLIGAEVTDRNGVPRRLAENDIMVVAPYNAQVRRVTEVLRDRGLASVPVGTVDKFQGREAEIVFFTMATSSGEDLPRDLDFLFSRNRLNVAISRARCLAVVVASPRLLDVACRTPEQMQLVNALCRFVEMARELSTTT